MKFKPGDIVSLPYMTKDFLVVGYGFDLENKKQKYSIYSEDGELYFVEEEELTFISNLDDEIEKQREEDNSGAA